jgi:hypothetical protein
MPSFERSPRAVAGLYCGPLAKPSDSALITGDSLGTPTDKHFVPTMSTASNSTSPWTTDVGKISARTIKAINRETLRRLGYGPGEWKLEYAWQY